MNKLKEMQGTILVFLLLYLGTYGFFRSHPTITYHGGSAHSHLGCNLAKSFSAKNALNVFYWPLLKMDKALTGMPYEFTDQ